MTTLKRALWLGLLGVVLCIGIAAAQAPEIEPKDEPPLPPPPDPGSIQVHGFAAQTQAVLGSDADAGYVEVRNVGEYWLRVEVQQKLRNPQDQFFCSNCQPQSACVGASTEGVCVYTKTEILEVPPFACRRTPSACMPDHSDPMQDCCDNHVGPGCHHGTLFCPFYSRLVARVVGYKVAESDAWITADTHVCGLWDGEPRDPGLPRFPICGNSSQCKDGLRDACQ